MSAVVLLHKSYWMIWTTLFYWGTGGGHESWMEHEAQVSQPHMWYCWLESCNMWELFDCSFTFGSILTRLLLGEEKRFIFFGLIFALESKLCKTRCSKNRLWLNSCLWLCDISILCDRTDQTSVSFAYTECLLCHPSWMFWTPSPCSCTVDKSTTEGPERMTTLTDY